MTPISEPTVAVRVAGRFDAMMAPDVRAELEAVFDSGRHHITVDLRDIEFLDSAALAVLVAMMKKTRAAGGDVVLVKPHNEEAFRILRLTRFDKVFSIVNAPA